MRDTSTLGVATLTALLCESVIFISLSETVCACVTGGFRDAEVAHNK